MTSKQAETIAELRRIAAREGSTVEIRAADPDYITAAMTAPASRDWERTSWTLNADGSLRIH